MYICLTPLNKVFNTVTFIVTYSYEFFYRFLKSFKTYAKLSKAYFAFHFRSFKLCCEFYML